MFIPTTEKERQHYKQAQEASKLMAEAGMTEKQIDMLAQMLTLSFNFAIEVGWETATRLMLSIAQTNVDMRKLGL